MRLSAAHELDSARPHCARSDAKHAVVNTHHTSEGAAQ